MDGVSHVELRPHPQFWELGFWALPACQVSFSLNLHLEASGSWSLCLELEALTLGERPWQGEGSASQSQDTSCSRPNLCPRGQAGPKGATALEPGGLAQPNAPLWPGDKASLNLAPGLSLGDLRDHRSCSQTASNQGGRG